MCRCDRIPNRTNLTGRKAYLSFRIYIHHSTEDKHTAQASLWIRKQRQQVRVWGWQNFKSPALEPCFRKPDRLPKGSTAFKPAPQMWTPNHEPVCSSLDSSYNSLLASSNSSLPSWNGNYETEGEGSRHWVFLTWVSICLRRLASKTRVGLTSTVPVLRQRSRVWFNVSMP